MTHLRSSPPRRTHSNAKLFQSNIHSTRTKNLFFSHCPTRTGFFRSKPTALLPNGKTHSTRRERRPRGRADLAYTETWTVPHPPWRMFPLRAKTKAFLSRRANYRAVPSWWEPGRENSPEEVYGEDEPRSSQTCWLSRWTPRDRMSPWGQTGEAGSSHFITSLLKVPVVLNSPQMR